MSSRAIIFDLFGTLVPKWPSRLSRQSVDSIAAEIGAPSEPFRKAWSDTFLERELGRHGSVGRSVRLICMNMGHDVADDVIAAAVLKRLDPLRQFMRPRADAVETLRTLRGRGFRIRLCSNAGPDAPAIWPELEIADLVDAVVFSSIEGLMKPDPRIYHSAAARLGVRPADCVFIGDGGSRELTGAEGVGMRAVYLHVADEVATEGADDDALQWRGPRITAIREVLRILELG